MFPTLLPLKILGPQKFLTPRNPWDFRVGWKIASDCGSSCVFWGKKRPFDWRRQRSLRAPRLKKINLAWNFQCRLKCSISIEIFNLDFQNSHKLRGLVGGSLENYNLARKLQSRLKSWHFSIIGGGALKVCDRKLRQFAIASFGAVRFWVHIACERLFRYLGVVSPHLPVGKKFLRFCLAWSKTDWNWLKLSED